MSARRHVMLDRDGTIIEHHHYLSDPNKVALLPNAANGMRQLMDAGFGLVLLTNQSALARGILNEKRLAQIHDRMSALLLAEGVHLDGIYFCPHHPEEYCDCRKPATGMAQRAARELGFDPSEGFVIGDNTCDIRMGHTLKATTFLVRTGYGLEIANLRSIRPDYVVDNIAAAARVICATAAQQEVYALS